ncbi:MAG: histidine phosphatase family protein [Halanaerobiales bacterium]|nr:histidine phosphatase family protein [Halanaerobiales bacterium]
MLEIYLLRHGVTPWNVERRFQGSQDILLSEEGVRQAEKARDRLIDLEFDAIYSSDLKRAYQTAEIIAKPHGIDVIPLEGIREINMGDWEGMLWDDIQREYADIHQVWVERPTMAAVPNGEGVIKAHQRAFRTFIELAQKHISDQRILVVAHGLINGTILCRIDEMSLDEWFQMRQGNTAVNIIQFDGKEFCSTLINCTKHIESEETIKK